MGSFYRKPEETRLDLGGGDWLLVRKHLTAGESRHIYAKTIKAGTIRPGERPELDIEQLEISQAVEYLIDWSLTDADDKPIRIRDQSYDFVAAALKGQTPEGLRIVLDAIQTHDAAMTEARAEEKKLPAGVSAP